MDLFTLCKRDNMLHPSRKGIYCDLCGKEVLIESDMIEYYNIDMKKVIAKKDSKIELEQSIELDFCVDCHQKLYDRVHRVSLSNDEKRKNYASKHL